MPRKANGGHTQSGFSQLLQEALGTGSDDPDFKVTVREEGIVMFWREVEIDTPVGQVIRRELYLQYHRDEAVLVWSGEGLDTVQ